MDQKRKTVNKPAGHQQGLGPFSYLGPAPDVPSIDEVHVLDRTFAKLLPGQIVEPEDGYDVHSPHGLLSYGSGLSSRLLRLVDVFEWMRCKELPRKKVLDAIFSPLVQLDEADGGYRRQELYVVNGEDYAHPLSLGDRLNPKARAVWDELEFAYQHTYSMGVVRQVAEKWEESWPGYVGDPGPFYRDGWVQHCKAMKILAQSNYGPKGWEEEYRSRYYLTQEEWISRCKGYVRLLSRLAVPLSLAHELWGWGHAAVAVAQLDAAADAPAAPAIGALDVTDWPSLVRYRQQFAQLIEQERYQELPGWLPEHVALLAGQLQQECAAGRKRGALGRLAKELGYVRGQRVSELLKKHGYSAVTGETVQASANPFDGLQARNIKAG